MLDTNQKNRPKNTSRVRDRLANERTYLAWMRTRQCRLPVLYITLHDLIYGSPIDIKYFLLECLNTRNWLTWDFRQA